MKNPARKITTNNTRNIINQTTANQETITIFVPIEIKKRGGTAMIIMPKNASKNIANNTDNVNEDNPKHFDNKLIKSIAKAYKWKIMLNEASSPNEKAFPKTKASNPSSLAEIARTEKLNSAYVSKIFNLNFLSPKIIEAILTGTQPRSLKLQDIITNKTPNLWHEQEEKLGF